MCQLYIFCTSADNSLKSERMNDMLNKIALALLIIGGVNWGLVGLLQFDLVAFIFGSAASLLARAVYTLVGISALLAIPMLFSGESVM